MPHLSLDILVIYLIINFSTIYCQPLDDTTDSIDDCPVPSIGSTTFRKTGPNSKYLYDPKAQAEDFEEIRNICESIGLEIAEVRNAADLNHLANFTKEQKITGRNWALGMTDESKEGVFIEQGGTPMQFQAFWTSEPDNGDGGSNCLELAFAGEGEYLAMFDVPCSKRAFPLCQFKKTDKCNLDSPTSVTAQKENPIYHIGNTASRKYFASSIQKTWTEALVYCARNGKKLVDFPENDAEIENIYKFAQTHMALKGLHEFNGFWSSGKYESKVDDDDFRWQSTDVPFINQDISSAAWAWMPDEPKDSSGNDLETCIAFFAPNQIGHSTRPLLSASNCKLVYYFMCFEMLVDNTTQSKYYLPPRPIVPGPGDGGTNPCLVKSPPKLNLEEPGLSTKDSLAFALFNINNQLQLNRVSIKLDPMLNWRVPIVDLLAQITRQICPPEVVNHAFINIMKNAMLVYYHSLDYAGKDVDKQRWNIFTKDLNYCLKKLNPMHFFTHGFSIVGFSNGPENSSQQHSIHPRQESIDSRKILPDLVIDTFWHMFTLSAGACFPTITDRSKTEWVSEFLFFFNQDFMNGFLRRWISAGEVNYGAFIGDIDVGINLWNLRSCSAAVYKSNEIDNLYFARPLFLSSIGRNTRNIKTGDLPY